MAHSRTAGAARKLLKTSRQPSFAAHPFGTWTLTRWVFPHRGEERTWTNKKSEPWRLPRPLQPSMRWFASRPCMATIAARPRFDADITSLVEKKFSHTCFNLWDHVRRSCGSRCTRCCGAASCYCWYRHSWHTWSLVGAVSDYTGCSSSADAHSRVRGTHQWLAMLAALRTGEREVAHQLELASALSEGVGSL